MSNPIIYISKSAPFCFFLQRKKSGLTSWRDIRHVDGRLQYRLGSCIQQKYHTLFFFREKIKSYIKEKKKRGKETANEVFIRYWNCCVLKYVNSKGC